MTSERERTYVYSDGKLETDESFDQLKAFMLEEMRRIEENPQVGLDYLYGTGMYDKKGHLKPEFA